MTAINTETVDYSLNWSLEPIEISNRTNWSLSLPKIPTVVEMLAAPIAQLRDLGALEERNQDPMRLLKGKESPVLKLSRLLEDIVPMIESFRNPDSRRLHWWQRFTGENLEREVTYLHACEQLEVKARLANDLAIEVQGMRDTLRDEAQGVKFKAEWLSDLVERAQVVMSDINKAERSKACFVNQLDYWPRFTRRVDNLNAIKHSQLLNVEQLKLADLQAQAILDRHADIVTVLVPLWRQRMNFGIFSKNTASRQELRS
jgi:hypothetical protein